MTIAFYKVDNSLNYERHEFDQFCDQPQEIMDMLQRLPEEEVKFYNADKYSWQSKEPTLADFESDYNDEELDGGWWCIVIQEPKEQKVYLIVQDKPFGKVFARVFGSMEEAEKAMNERDEISGERLYADCHIIERTIE